MVENLKLLQLKNFTVENALFELAVETASSSARLFYKGTGTTRPCPWGFSEVESPELAQAKIDELHLHTSYILGAGYQLTS